MMPMYAILLAAWNKSHNVSHRFIVNRIGDNPDEACDNIKNHAFWADGLRFDDWYIEDVIRRIAGDGHHGPKVAYTPSDHNDSDVCQNGQCIGEAVIYGMYEFTDEYGQSFGIHRFYIKWTETCEFHGICAKLTESILPEMLTAIEA